MEFGQHIGASSLVRALLMDVIRSSEHASQTHDFNRTKIVCGAVDYRVDVGLPDRSITTRNDGDGESSKKYPKKPRKSMKTCWPRPAYRRPFLVYVARVGPRTRRGYRGQNDTSQKSTYNLRFLSFFNLRCWINMVRSAHVRWNTSAQNVCTSRGMLLSR